MAEPPTVDPADAGSDRKRRAILDAARRHFLVEGFASAGMEAIARSASVSTATIYSYFPSKTELFDTVVEDAGRDFGAAFPPGPSGESAEAQLRAFALAYARFMGDPFVRSIFRLVAAERRRFATTARHFFERGRSEFGGALMRILRQMSDEGTAKFPKLSWAAGQLMGMIEHPTFLVPMVTGEEVTVERTLEAICDEAVATFLARYAVKPGSREETLADPPRRKVLAPEP